MRWTIPAVSVCTFPWGLSCEAWFENTWPGGCLADPVVAGVFGAAAGYPGRQSLGVGASAGFERGKFPGPFGWPVECRSPALATGRQSGRIAAAALQLVAAVPDALCALYRAVGSRAGRPALRTERARREWAAELADAETAGGDRVAPGTYRQPVARRQRAAQGVATGRALDGEGIADRCRALAARRPQPGPLRAAATEWRLAADGRRQAAVAGSGRRALGPGAGGAGRSAQDPQAQGQQQRLSAGPTDG